jgi:hypothetical protein
MVARKSDITWRHILHLHIVDHVNAVKTDSNGNLPGSRPSTCMYPSKYLNCLFWMPQVCVPHGYHHPEHQILLGHNIEHLSHIGDAFELAQHEHELDVVVFVGKEPEEGRHPMVDVEAVDEATGVGMVVRQGLRMREAREPLRCRGDGMERRRRGRAWGEAARVFTRAWCRGRGISGGGGSVWKTPVVWRLEMQCGGKWEE